MPRGSFSEPLAPPPAAPGPDRRHRHSELGAGGVSQAAVGDATPPALWGRFSQHLGANLCLSPLVCLGMGPVVRKSVPGLNGDRISLSCWTGGGGGGVGGQTCIRERVCLSRETLSLKV